MATKSILKEINIKDKRLAHTFVQALGQAENTRYESVPLTRECKQIAGDKIKDFFGKK